MHATPKPKAIIAIWHIANKGKTETLREVANLMLQSYPNHVPIFPIPFTVPQSGDFRLVMSINGKVVAIESQGDPHTDLNGRLLELANNFRAELIFCYENQRRYSSRSQNLRMTQGFETIWTSTYQTDMSHSLVNRMKAKHIIELACGLSLL